MTAAATIATMTRDWVGSNDVPIRELTEPEVLALASQGDHEAFRILVERNERRVYALALRILRDPERARDALQDAFLKAYRALPRFQGRSSFSTWMYRLTYNHCLDLIRRDKSNRTVEWDDERMESAQLGDDPGEPRTLSTLGPSPAAALEQTELRGRLAQALATLPDNVRQILTLREIEGLSYAEIAELLEIPKGTVMSRLFHARRKAREALQELGFGLEDASDESCEEGT